MYCTVSKKVTVHGMDDKVINFQVRIKNTYH